MGCLPAAPASGAAALRAATCACLLCVTGCGILSAGREETVQLPPLPAAWVRRFPGLCCSLLAPDASGQVRERPLSGWPSAIRLELPRDSPVPILAVPEHRGIALRPAGGLCAGPGLRLSWEQGPLAAALLGLAASGWDLSRLNTSRLAEEVAALGLRDPWLLDTGHLLRRITAHELRETDVRVLETSERLLSLPQGEWLADYPLSDPVSSSGTVTAALPAGFRSYFHAALPLRADVYSDPRESLVLVAAHPF